MTLKQPIINTFNRVGIDYTALQSQPGTIEVSNRFGGGSCTTTPFMAMLIAWVYSTSDKLEMGISEVKITDFDRIRYFILATDPTAYSTCID